MFSDIAMPAALSAADDTETPEESRAIDFCRERWDEPKFLWAVKDPLLVLIANGVAMTFLLIFVGERCHR